MRDLPTGTVTFLFSDVERSTELLERHGAAVMGPALAQHHALLEEVIERHGGEIFETVGDAVYAAFPTASGGVAAALETQRVLAAAGWGPIGRLAVRIALHTGAVERRGDHYFGTALFRAARLLALGHGEQTLLSGIAAQLAADALPAGASLHDLGSHRLKDLGEPERVFQLNHPDLAADFPPLRSLDAQSHNLPVGLNSFVGRERELAELDELLARHRLVTVLGPGGIGKTRLALHAAANRIAHFRDGAWFVDLSVLRDPDLVPGAIATVHRLRERHGEPIMVTLAGHLSAKDLLLVLDNLEHLLPAAAATVAELLTSAPNLRILATSRAPLRIQAEREYPLLPLASSRQGLEPSSAPAVELFVDRAGAIRPEMRPSAETAPLVADICIRLDGLPLAIELAAARLRIFTLAQLHDRLTRRLPVLTGGARDLPERQQTLRSAISWSTELLSEGERGLFRRLAVFRGGWTLDAAQAIGGADEQETVGRLDHLLEQSLTTVAHDRDGRGSMLETIRELAAEELEVSGETHTIERRHADFFTTFAEQTAPALLGPERDAWLERLGADLDNFRAVLDRAAGAGDTEIGLRLASSLLTFWHLRDRASEGRSRIEAFLASDLTDVAPAAVAAGHAAVGELATFQSDFGAGVSHLSQALPLYRQLRDPAGIAHTLNMLAWASAPRDQAAALALFQDALPWAKAAASPAILGDSLLGTSVVEMRLGRATESAAHALEAVAAFEAAGERHLHVYALITLGHLVAAQGRVPEAAALFTRAIEMAATGGPSAFCSALEMTAHFLFDNGDGIAAVRLASASERRRQESEGATGIEMAGMEPPLTRGARELDHASFEGARVTGAGLTDDEAAGEALAAIRQLSARGASNA